MTTSDRHRRTQSGRSTNRRKKASTSVLLLLSLLAGLVGFAPSAFAHHPQMTATAACGPTPGTYVVTVNAKSWSFGSAGAHSDIDLYWGATSVTWPGTSATPPAGSNVAQVFERNGAAVNPATNDGGTFANIASPGGGSTAYASFTAKFQITTALSQIEVIAHADGTWGNGNAGNEWRGVLDGNGDNGTPALVNLPTNCTYADLDLTAGPTCTEGGFDVTIKNNGTGTGSATVTYTQSPGPDASVSFTNITAGTSQTKLIPILEGSTYTLSFTGPFQPAQGNIDGTRNCDTPDGSASATLVCAAQSVVNVSLGTIGDSTTADVYAKVGDGSFVKQNGAPISVPLGGSTYPVDVTENTTVTIRVEFLGDGAKTVTLDPITVDCDKPAPTIGTPVCAEGGLNVVLGNVEGTDTATFTVVIDGVESTEDVVAGTTRTILIPVAEDATVSVSITSGDQSYVNEALTRDCEAPGASVVFDCAVGGVRVALTNAGELPATVNVNGEQVVVPAGTTADAPVTRTIAVAEGAPYSITVLDQTASGTRDCEQPAIESVNLECAEGGVVVILTNAGELPATVTVNGNAVKIPAGGEVSVTESVDENAAYDFDIVIDGVTTNVVGVRDCERPAVVSAGHECAEGGVLVVLTNDGPSDTTVTVDGLEVNVPAGTTAEAPVTVLVPVDENATYDFTVVGDELDERFTGTADCLLPEAVVVGLTCAKGGLSVNLRNDGDDTATFVLTSPALPDGEVTVAVNAGDTEAVIIPLAEEASTDLEVTSDDEVLFNDTITRDCETVEGEVTRPTAPLPRTGADSSGLLGLAGALLLAGAALVLGGRRRETAVH